MAFRRTPILLTEKQKRAIQKRGRDFADSDENAETPRHATAQLRYRVPLELRETKQLLKALPGSTA